jgi:hypothetical protein
LKITKWINPIPSPKSTETAVNTRLYGHSIYSLTIITTTMKRLAGQLQDKAIKQGLKGLYSPFKEQDICEEFNFIFLAK